MAKDKPESNIVKETFKIDPKEAQKKVEESESPKRFAKSVHLGLGLDLLGSKTSLNSKAGSTLEVTPMGIEARNSKGRVVLIPWANIKGVELL